MMNDIFDALNRKHPAEGVRKNDKNLEVFYMFCVHVECQYISVHLCFI